MGMNLMNCTVVEFSTPRISEGRKIRNVIISDVCKGKKIMSKYIQFNKVDKAIAFDDVKTVSSFPDKLIMFESVLKNLDNIRVSIIDYLFSDNLFKSKECFNSIAEYESQAATPLYSYNKRLPLDFMLEDVVTFDNLLKKLPFAFPAILIGRDLYINTYQNNDDFIKYMDKAFELFHNTRGNTRMSVHNANITIVDK